MLGFVIDIARDVQPEPPCKRSPKKPDAQRFEAPGPAQLSAFLSRRHCLWVWRWLFRQASIHHNSRYRSRESGCIIEGADFQNPWQTFLQLSGPELIWQPWAQTVVLTAKGGSQLWQFWRGRATGPRVIPRVPHIHDVYVYINMCTGMYRYCNDLIMCQQPSRPSKWEPCKNATSPKATVATCRSLAQKTGLAP